MIDLMIRAKTRANFIAFLKAQALLWDDESPRDGVAIDEVGNIEVTPAVLDGDGNVLTPAVLDPWLSFNVRIFGDRAAADEDVADAKESDGGKADLKFTRSKIAASLRSKATVKEVNGVQAYQVNANIQIIDPRSVATPKRVWMGGMSF